MNNLVLACFKPRAKDSYKGDYGRLMIYGGSFGMMGAVCLVARGAMRTGAGLVYIASPLLLVNFFNLAFTEAVIKGYPDELGTISHDSIDTLLADMEKASALVIGPGLGVSPNARKIILDILKNLRKPVVLDADGINNIHRHELKHIKASVIITPHYGEFSRLMDLSIADIQSSGNELSRRAAGELNITIVLKSHRTLITDGERSIENTTGNPGMATAGSGDVLSGMIGGLLAMGNGVFESAVAGTYVHGLAGDIAAVDKGEYGLIASDIVECLPSAVLKVQKYNV
ncbi:MAG: NAD(P)H-hydrate dehydratase [Candidatus Margulisbacteria bacterium GWF2_38_17]|nr:MAG: NAD(P)H-hydrate dehydratase [Candidatus Margulisbacteria bacterium GWF2_38_17]OGI11266.1 MAG: NAD(P)H-hydrate dehydratase [Candidatus Margulisbacteria bacterium GWE2_39_32]